MQDMCPILSHGRTSSGNWLGAYYNRVLRDGQCYLLKHTFGFWRYRDCWVSMDRICGFTSYSISSLGALQGGLDLTQATTGSIFHLCFATSLFFQFDVWFSYLIQDGVKSWPGWTLAIGTYLSDGPFYKANPWILSSAGSDNIQCTIQVRGCHGKTEDRQLLKDWGKCRIRAEPYIERTDPSSRETWPSSKGIKNSCGPQMVWD